MHVTGIAWLGAPKAWLRYLDTLSNNKILPAPKAFKFNNHLTKQFLIIRNAITVKTNRYH